MWNKQEIRGITLSTRRIGGSSLRTINIASIGAVFAIGIWVSGCTSESTTAPTASPTSEQWDMCGSLSPEVGRLAGFVSPSKEDLDKGYDPSGSERADPRVCDRMTSHLDLMFSTWSNASYAQTHGPGSPAYSNTTAVTIDGRSVTESHDSDHDCRLEFHTQNGKVVVMTAHARSEDATPVCNRLLDVAAALSSIMPR